MFGLGVWSDNMAGNGLRLGDVADKKA